MPLYRVTMIYKGQMNYVIDAPDELEARKLVWNEWEQGDDRNVVKLGNEWDASETTEVKPVPVV